MNARTLAEEPEARRGRRVWIAVAALAAYAAFVLLFCTENTWRPEWDGAIYLLTSQALAAGEGYTYVGEPFFLRPPGFAWLLSHSVSGPPHDFAALNRGLLVTAVLAVIALYVSLRGGKHRALALPAALLVGTASLWVRNFNWVLSEFPFLAVLFLSIAALQRGGRREEHWWIWSVMGALGLAGAFYLRSMALLVLPALLFVGWTRDRGRAHARALIPLVIVAVLGAPWILHARAAAAEAPVPAEQLLLHDYATATLHVDPGDPASPRLDAAAWRARVGRNGAALAADMAHTLVGSRSTFWSALAATCVLLGLGLSLRRGPDLFDGFFLAYLTLGLAYFVYEERLLLPLVPQLYLYPLTLFGTIGAAVGRRLGDRARWARAGSVGLAIVVFAVVSIRQYGSATDARAWAGGGGATLGQSWDDLERAAEWIRAETPADATILCSRAPMLGVLTGRRCYTYRFIRDQHFLARFPASFVVFDAAAPLQLRQFLRAQAIERHVLESALPGNGIEVLGLRSH